MWIALAAGMWAGQGAAERRRELPADADVGVVTLQHEPGRLYFVSRHAITGLDETTALQWTHAPKLRAAATALGLRVLGPTEYHVRFDAGRCATFDQARFAGQQLEIALPVDSPASGAGAFAFAAGEPFRCLSLIYRGSPMDVSTQWQRLYDDAQARGLTPSCENRQLIVNHTGFDRTRYLTELQLGVAP